MTTDISAHYDPITHTDILIDEYDGGNSSSRLFERARIKALAEERELVQKKTFTKWVNSHLARANIRINDLYTDLRDGKNLIKLLEILSGERLQRPTKGKMRIHCLENVDKALQFLLKEQRVHFENLGSHDIVDGNPRLTLGLIWTIILRFQIQDITIEEVDNQETKSAKDALLLWCQMKTAGYHSVNVRNFTTSWKDGLAFNALIHKHRPDLINYEKLSKANPVQNLNNAFNVAEDKLGLVKLLDAEDVYTDNPDEKSIITYVVTYYHYFSKWKADTVQGRRIGKVIGQTMETEKMIADYERLTSELLKWIEMKIDTLSDRQFANSLTGVQNDLQQFNNYRTIEKPPKFDEKGNLEILLFTLQSQMRANNQKPYTPREGKMISDINKAWERLEKAEHERELALREELIRQEKLEQLAARFDRKAGMRETWLNENQRLVLHENFGNDLSAVEAAAKKHEAIETDISAYQERVQAVVQVALELESENYHAINRINTRKDNVLRLWTYLQELLKNRRTRLEMCLNLQKALQEVNYIQDSINEIKGRLLTDDYGKHLMSVEDLIQKHTLIEADINVLSERVKTVAQNLKQIRDEEGPDGFKPCDPQLIDDRLKELEAAFTELYQLADTRRHKLEESKKLCQYYWDMAEEEAWIKEKEQILSSNEIGHDVTTNQLLISKNRALEDEIAAHYQQLQNAVNAWYDFANSGHYGADDIKRRTDEILASWDNLKELQALRNIALREGNDYHQFFTDADDVEAWMLDFSRLVSSKDVGIDEASGQSLLKKHNDCGEELKNYYGTIMALKQQADSLGDNYRNRPEIVNRIDKIDRMYGDLNDAAERRRQMLTDAIDMYRLMSESDGVEQWMVEKEKMLDSMVPSRDMEDIEVMKHRFDTFEQEMNANEPRMDYVNRLAEQLHQAGHPNARDIADRNNRVNNRWKKLKNNADRKKDDIDASHGVQTFHIECRETISWIEEKTKLLQSTEELGNDLAGIMTLQRRLSGMERDLAAICSQIDNLENEAQKIEDQHPEEAEEIRERITQISAVFEQLNQLIKQRDAKLEEAGDLHRFLRDLDHFQTWLKNTQTAVASEDTPNNLIEAEKLLNQHQQIKEEIDNYAPEFKNIMDYGDKLTQGQTDHQHMFLRERLKALRDGWDELHKMWDNRQKLLSESLNSQLFLRDSKQVEVLLNQQEHYLGKDETPANLEQAEEMLKRHESFMNTLDANEERVRNVLLFAKRLTDENHFDSDKIQKKAANIEQRFVNNREKSKELWQKLQDMYKLQQFLQNCDELNEWIQEKYIIAQDETYRSAKTIHSKWTRHQAFEAEIAANKDRLYQIQKQAQDLLGDKPEMKKMIDQKLNDLDQQFDTLETTTNDKGQKLFDAKRPVLYEQTCDDIDSWLTDIENQVLAAETGQDLTSVNLSLQKQQMIENQLAVKAKQVNELESQVMALKKIDPAKTDELKAKKSYVEEKFNRLQQPLQDRKQQLLKKKEAYQFRRDVEDEKMWIQEKLPLARSTDYGNSLFSVQMLIKKNQSLRTEIDNHEPRILNIIENGRKLIGEGHEDSPEFARLIDELNKLWDELKNTMDVRKNKLLESELAQQYYFDASEAESWMSEQELYMMVEDRGKDEFTTQNLIKKHESLENAVDDYAATIKQLGETAMQLIKSGHPESDQIAIRQSQVEKLYAGLKDLAQERRSKLEESLRFCGLKREFDDLLQWINEKEVVAGSHELGQDFDQVTMLRERFNQFARETENIGNERIDEANENADNLINSGHVDGAVIAELKDNLNDSYAELLELMETRKQMLLSSWELHKFFHDCKDILGRISEKSNSMSDELGRDAVSVSNLLRKHQNFEHDLQTLKSAVHQITDESKKLQVLYAGDRANEIIAREQEVVNAWNKMLTDCDLRRHKLEDTGDLFKFFNMVRDLILWMDDIVRQMNSSDKPRDVSGVELLMNNHQSLKSEIDARNDNFTNCFNLGNELLSRNHYASKEISEKLNTLQNQRSALKNRWEERWDHLQLILEVYQFARDAAVAEAWLIAQEPYLLSQELGHTIDEVEQLIKKHEAFEKSAFAQEERFVALERLTTFELREYQKQEEKERKMKEKPSATAMAEKVSTAAKQQPMAEMIDTGAVATKPESPKGARAEGEGRDEKSEELHESHIDDDVARQQEQEKLIQPTGTDSDDIIMEGFVNRKHEWESTTKRSSNRSWDKVFVVLKKSQLLFYKDQKHSKNEPEKYYKGEPAIQLDDVQVEIASNYTKKKHVFRLKLSNGAEYLFQAKDDGEMECWLNTINSTIRSQQQPSPGPSRSQTMPAKGAIDPTKMKESEASRKAGAATSTGGGGGGLFTLKKK
ncbi:spectrin beta chain isoform X2 [Dermatophagoides farinae]|uniref:spectrin beta chain isoform X2 n=1 Tax=Dermatophagoides farinae TaxID=6954 RepID=UPI003F5DEB08